MAPWKVANGVWGLQGEEEAPVPGLRGGARDSFTSTILRPRGAIPAGIASCSAGVRTDAKLEPLADGGLDRRRGRRRGARAGGRSHYWSFAPARCRWAGGTGLFREFLGRLSTPRTCALGYNSLRLTTNSSALAPGGTLIPTPGNGKAVTPAWDLMDLVRLAYALRPEGLQWPEENGRAVFRLEALASANGISQPRAHDARDDVWATLGLARALRAAQPKLFAYYLGLRDKQRARSLLPKPFAGLCLFVSGRFDLARRRLAVITPVAPHPTNGNGVIVADLSFEDDRWPGPPEALRRPIRRVLRPASSQGGLAEQGACPGPLSMLAARIDGASILISIGPTRCGSALLGSKGWVSG